MVPVIMLRCPDGHEVVRTPLDNRLGQRLNEGNYSGEFCCLRKMRVVSMTVHYIDESHWSGRCDSTSGMGSTDPDEVTCWLCIMLAAKDRHPIESCDLFRTVTGKCTCPEPEPCGGRDPAYPGTCQFRRGHGGPCFDNDDPGVDA